MMGRQTADQARLFYEFHRSRGSPWHQRVRQSLSSAAAYRTACEAVDRIFADRTGAKTML